MASLNGSKIVNFLRVKDDGEDGRFTDRWTNADILPVLPQNRTYTTKHYFGYWVSCGIAATYWTMGSSAIANGLSANLTIGAMVIGGFLSAALTWGCGEFGVKYYLGFPMMSRAIFGMYGSYFVVIIKCFGNFIYGIQAYWGGIALRVMLSAIFPSFHRMGNSFPESANITTKDFIGTMIYFCLFVPLLFVKPHKLQPFFLLSFVGVSLTILGMFIWALAANGGAGDLVGPTIESGQSETAFKFVQAICTLCTTYAGGSLRHSDWSRYTATPSAARWGMWVACPIAVILCSIFGTLVTSAATSMYGQVIWQPMLLLAHIQEVDYSPTTRAGTFFAGLGWFLSQLAVNVAANAIAVGMDLASLAPQWLNARRGSLMLAVIAIATTPWNFVNAPGTFITVVGSFGIFVAPLAGIYVADYHVVRRKNYKIPDLYIGDKSSIYWYQWGFHWRACLTWLSLVWVSLPGFATRVSGYDVGLTWIRIFQLAFMIGLFGGFGIYIFICWLSPIPGQYDYEPWDYDGEPTSTAAAAELKEKEADLEESETKMPA